MPLPVVVIVGRPNVGKSTLFNRILKRRTAVVDPAPGVTRDRNYADAVWNGVRFTLVDTGGYLPVGEGDELAKAVTEQTLIAAEEADVALFIIDGLTGVTETDQNLARVLLRRKARTLLVVNKIDDVSQIGLTWETGTLGLGEPRPVSALTGFQVAEVLDDLVEILREIQPIQPYPTPAESLSLAVIGAPNTGKSSLVNRLCGDRRMVVSEIPGTTRDAVDTVIQYYGKSIRLIDTAGLRRKRFGLQGIEFYTTLRALRALARCQVAALLIDAQEGLTKGDLQLLHEAADKGVGVVLAMNKWDAVEKDAKSADLWLADWRQRAPNFAWVPVVFISALTGQRAVKVVEKALEVHDNRERRVSTAELNESVGQILINRPPPAVKGKLVKVKYIAQVSSAPPHFVCFTTHSNLVPVAYKKFVERLIRERFNFEGVPIKVSFRGK